MYLFFCNPNGSAWFPFIFQVLAIGQLKSTHASAWDQRQRWWWERSIWHSHMTPSASTVQLLGNESFATIGPFLLIDRRSCCSFVLGRVLPKCATKSIVSSSSSSFTPSPSSSLDELQGFWYPAEGCILNRHWTAVRIDQWMTQWDIDRYRTIYV